MSTTTPVVSGDTAPTQEQPPIALIPERAQPDGPVTTARLRRTVAGYGAIAAAGIALAFIAGRRPAANLGVGLIAPGAGYLSAGKPFAYAATQPAFLISLGMWLGSGNVLAPQAFLRPVGPANPLLPFGDQIPLGHIEIAVEGGGVVVLQRRQRKRA